jgi:hypothetical protein
MENTLRILLLTVVSQLALLPLPATAQGPIERGFKAFDKKLDEIGKDIDDIRTTDGNNVSVTVINETTAKKEFTFFPVHCNKPRPLGLDVRTTYQFPPKSITNLVHGEFDTFCKLRMTETAFFPANERPYFALWQFTAPLTIRIRSDGVYVGGKKYNPKEK